MSDLLQPGMNCVACMAGLAICLQSDMVFGKLSLTFPNVG